MSVLRRGTAARAAQTVKGPSSAGVKQAMSYGLIGAAARLWVRIVSTWLGGLRAKQRKGRCSRAEGFPKKSANCNLGPKQKVIALGVEQDSTPRCQQTGYTLEGKGPQLLAEGLRVHADGYLVALKPSGVLFLCCVQGQNLCYCLPIVSTSGRCSRTALNTHCYSTTWRTPLPLTFITDGSWYSGLMSPWIAFSVPTLMAAMWRRLCLLG